MDISAVFGIRAWFFTGTMRRAAFAGDLRTAVFDSSFLMNENLKKKSFVLEEFFREHGSEVKKVTELDFTFERRLEFAEEEKQQAIREAKEQAIMEGRTEGRIEAILELLEDLGDIPDALKDRIMQQKDAKVLKKWHKLAAKAESISAFEGKME